MLFRKDRTAREERVISYLADSPLGQKLEAEAEAELAKARQAVQAELRALEEQIVADLKPADARVTAAEAAHRLALAKSQEATEASRQAHNARRSRVYAYDFAKGRLEAQLRESAPECIGEFIAELDARWEILRNFRIEVVLSPATYIDGRRHWVADNRESRDGAFAAHRNARAAAVALQTDPNVADIPAAIAALRASLLEIEAPKLTRKQQRELDGRDEDAEDAADAPGSSVYERGGVRAAG